MKACRRSPGATFYRDDGLHLEPPEGGALFKLAGAGLRLWELLEYPITEEALSRRASAEFDAEAGAMAREVKLFLSKLASRGLVESLPSPPSREDALRDRYLWLLKRALVNLIYPEDELRLEHLEEPPPAGRSTIERQRYLKDIGRIRPDLLDELKTAKTDGRVRGGRVTRFSHTMIGLVRLDNLERLAEAVFREKVPGDFLEAGVCQGGAAIFLRALQVAHGEAGRATWAADSFQGLPRPSAEPDAGLDFSEGRQPWLSFDLNTVAEHFRRYDLLDDGVFFLPGWFADSLPRAPVRRLAVLRIDADLYQSTRETLESLYDRVSPGGFVIIDDYGVIEACRRAVDGFRELRGVQAPLRRIDGSGVFWKKPS